MYNGNCNWKPQNMTGKRYIEKGVSGGGVEGSVIFIKTHKDKEEAYSHPELVNLCKYYKVICITLTVELGFLLPGNAT